MLTPWKAYLNLYHKRLTIIIESDLYYIITEHATADVGLIFTCFNLRRIFNLLDQNELKKYLKELDFIFLILRGYFNEFRSGLFKMKISKPFVNQRKLMA